MPSDWLFSHLLISPNLALFAKSLDPLDLNKVQNAAAPQKTTGGWCQKGRYILLVPKLEKLWDIKS